LENVHILIGAADDVIRRLLRATLDGRDRVIHEAHDTAEMLQIANELGPAIDVIVIDEDLSSDGE